MKNLYSLSERVQMRESILKQMEQDQEQFELNEDTLSMAYEVMTHSPVRAWKKQLISITSPIYNHEIESNLRSLGIE